MFKKTVKIIKKYAWVFIVLGIFIGVRWFYTRDGIKTLPVKIITPEDRVVEKTVSASGNVKSLENADLSFNATGRVIYIGVKKGDSIKKGQMIAKLDNDSTLQTVQYYRDARDVALRNRDLFVEQYESNKDAVSGKDEYDITLRKYDELVSQAEAAYLAQVDNVRNSYIYAPFDGVIVDLTKETGENASLGETVVKLENLNNIVFEVELDQEDYGLIKLGQEAKIELDAYNNVEFEGIVSLLPMYADGTSGSSFVIEMTINPKGNYNPLIGMTGDARIVVSKTDTKVPALVYDQILFDDGNKSYVFVLNGDLIEKQSVEIGLEGDIYTELKSLPDKQMVTGLNDKIEMKEGYKAKILKQ